MVKQQVTLDVSLVNMMKLIPKVISTYSIAAKVKSNTIAFSAQADGPKHIVADILKVSQDAVHFSPRPRD